HPPQGFGGTYTNVVFANGKLLVPQWKNAGHELNVQAVGTYQKLLPDWQIVPVDCTDFLPNSGAIHCATSNVPKMPVGI
ncbi:MAG: agmatine deiminase family protein, partial [Planctomycetales bacterium]|nr:agmatine deiminase family protein [Planctomycetales bacterium]